MLQFALAKIGAILVTANTSLRARDIDYLLRQSEAATLITIRGFRDVDYVDELAAIGATVRAAIAGARSGVIFIGERQRRAGFVPYDELRARAARRRRTRSSTRAPPRVGVDDVINMQYTSGTTGFPKGVMLSSRNIVNNGYALGRVLGYTPDDRLCLCVPLFHCFGCVIGVLGAFTHGACLCPVEAFDPKRVLETVAPRALHRALRRADDVHRGARVPGLRALRPDVAAHRRHGRRALSRAADAARDDRHAPAGDHDRLRADRSLAGHHDDAARLVGRAAIADGRVRCCRSSR